MSRFLFYPHARKVIEKLPKHYKKGYLKRYASNLRLPYLEEDEDKLVKAVNNSMYPKEFFDVPPAVIFPEESQRSLWGGEGIVKGFTEVRRTRTRIPKTWAPELRQKLFYSEILGRWLMIIVSLTALKQIERLKGLDNYLLMTPENEINSRLGMHIKREILLKLSDPEFKKLKPNLVAKYAQFIIPEDEAEWVGLTLDEAIKKQMKIDYLHERASALIPKKEVFAKTLLDHLDRDREHPHLPRPLDPKSSGSLRSTFTRFLYGEKGGMP